MFLLFYIKTIKFNKINSQDILNKGLQYFIFITFS